MYLTKFVRKDGKPDEEYWYLSEGEAVYHASLFVDDDSNLYSMIVASDEGKNAVLQVLIFDEKGKAISFKQGDVVRIRPEFCNSEKERTYIYAITNLNDRTMRCTMTCLNSGMALPGSELAGLNMIYPVGTTIEEIIKSTQAAGEARERGPETLSCAGCLDYDDCPYHEPSGFTPYMEDGTVGCPSGYAKSITGDGEQCL